ncbi:hypothetical protein SLEP1_g1489 [Rubroshorea leprosula]|uniref:Helicase C-terminal domain-containing protein n=1 Tax=Rubroshorea leprosula TaxID=152421 RepID=A0AAV5HL28_9ROSI|nr:hypothetical protein SLEP1_g1489 [Rubroshorea leprosula]
MAYEDITQVVHVIPSDAEKLPWLLEKLPEMIDDGDVLVFASKKTSVDEIESQLVQKGFKVAALHGDKDQASRMEILQKFKFGIFHVLVATDVAARGLDIKSINLIAAGQNVSIAAGQNVSMELMDLAMKDGRFRSKRDARKGGGKKGRGRGGGRDVRGVDFGLGIGYNPEPNNSSSHSVQSRSAAVNSMRTGMMTQFKSNFVAASSNCQSQGFSNGSSAHANKRPTLAGFVSGGTIGGDINRTQPSSFSPTPTSGANTTSQKSGENSGQKNSERSLPFNELIQYCSLVPVF